VYVSNESDEMVYFDNLQVTQNHARLIEENHYYAYGLKIAAISSKKLPDLNEGAIKNNNLYNDKELWDDADLNWYDYGFRNYDPQIGRFTQLDPLTDDYPELTPYQYASCDPIGNIDVDGLEGFNAVQTLSEVVITGVRHAAPVAAKMGATTIASIAIKTLDIATDFIPIVSGAKDIYQGVKSGNWLQAGLGVLSIAADVFTLGGSSVAKGAIKTAVREGAELLIKEEVEQIVKKEITKGGTYVLKDGETIVRTGRTKNLATREIQHKAGKETKDLTFEAVHHTDSHAEQRGLEHLLSKKFEKTASKANGGLNKIKAMSDKTLKSAKGQNYLKAAEDFLTTPKRF
jgi:RHS repeat-associated protein